jgi:uncharacterized protein involved in type VI secretion and phage assembly
MSGQQVNGIVIGIVIDLDDPERLGRVRVNYPYLGDEPSDWARVVTPMAGKNRGIFFRPEVADEVLVAFELGDVHRPYILGSLWSKIDTPPTEAGGSPNQNNARLIKSRSGHLVMLDDTKGKEKIEIVGSGGECKIVFDIVAQKIQITCESGDIEISAPASKVKVDATDIEVNATGNMTLEAKGTMTIKGGTVNIN